MSFSRLESFIFDKMSQTNLPGLSAAIVQDDQVTWTRGFGYRNLVAGLPATPHTLYGIASVTKSFTCLAIMQLAEQGKLAVDDPLTNYLDVDLQPQAAEPVRLWHLMTHTSGIPALASSESAIRNATGAGSHWLPVAGYEDLRAFLDQAPAWAVTEPGRRWFYLNEGYQLLGQIIEDLSGLPYPDYIKQHILAPLGMSRSVFSREAVEADPDAAVPYVITQAGERIPANYPYRAVLAQGGLISNALDLAAYLKFYLGQGQAGHPPIVSARSLQAMQTPRIDSPLHNGPFGQGSYGYGLGITPSFLGETLIGHSGSVTVSTSYLGFIPARKLGVVILINGSGYTPSLIGQYALALLLGHDPDKLPFLVRDRTLEGLTGVYETYKGTMQARVRRNGDFLLLEMGDKYGRSTVPLVPASDDPAALAFYTLSNGHRLAVDFRTYDGRPELLYERYLLRKIGPLND